MTVQDPSCFVQSAVDEVPHIAFQALGTGVTHSDTCVSVPSASVTGMACLPIFDQFLARVSSHPCDATAYTTLFPR